MQRHISEAEAPKARFAFRVLLVAPPSSQIRSNQACVVGGVLLDKIGQPGVVCAEEVHDFVADAPWYLRNAL
jgi:hypothetical protein